MARGRLRLIEVLLVLLAVSCVSLHPLSVDEVEKLYLAKDEARLESAVPQGSLFASAAAWERAKARLDQLKKVRLTAEAKRALAEKDEKFLALMASGDLDRWIDPSLRRAANQALDESRRKGFRARLAQFTQEGDLPGASTLLQEAQAKADPVLGGEVKRLLLTYETPDPVMEKYRQRSLDPAVLTVAAKIVEKAVADPPRGLPDVVRSLVGAETDPFRVSRILHDWICVTLVYDTDEFFFHRGHPQDYASVLRRGEAVCAGYAALFLEMARLAGLKARVVEGYSKGFSYTGKLPSRPDHAWNQVWIGGRWFSLDCTWDSGYLSLHRFYRRFSTQYFLLQPRPFSYTHLSSDPVRQLLAKPLSQAAFEQEPVIQGEFFRLGLALPSGGAPLVDQASLGAFSLQSDNPQVKLLLEVSNPDSPTAPGQSILLHRGRIQEARFSTPVKGVYRVKIYARNASEAAPPTSVSRTDFQELLAGLDKLIASKKLKPDDKAAFLGCFVEVAEEDQYHYLEDLRSPSRANFVLYVLRLVGERTRWYSPVLDLRVTVTSPLATAGYPEQYHEYSERTDFQLYGPLTGVLSPGKEYLFSAEVASVSELDLIQGETWLRLKRNLKGRFEGLFTPVGGAPVEVAVPSHESQYSVLLRYRVESDADALSRQ